MVKAINVLISILYLLSLLCCVAFKNSFVIMMALIFVGLTIIIKNKNCKCNNSINLICICWLILCCSFALMFHLIGKINIFDYFGYANIFSFIYGGIIIIALSFQLYLNRYKS